MQFAWLIDDIIPADAVFECAAFFAPKRFAVEKKLGLVARRINVDGGYLANAIRPIPVGQNVGHRKIGPPAGLVDIETVFWETAQIDNAEIRASRRNGDLVSRLNGICSLCLHACVGEIE